MGMEDRLLILALALSSCKEPDPTLRECGVYDFAYQYPNTEYDISPDSVTQRGIPVDRSGQSVGILHLDGMMEEVRVCLETNFPDKNLEPLFDNPSELASMDQTTLIRTTGCSLKDFSSEFEATFSPGCWVVKIPNDWLWSCTEPAQQLLNIRSGDSGCVEKGLSPTSACPCRYRMIAQDNAILVPPTALLFKDALVRMSTGCANPWKLPLMAECASP